MKLICNFLKKRDIKSHKYKEKRTKQKKTKQKLTDQSSSDFKLYTAENSSHCREESSVIFEVPFGTVMGKLRFFNIVDKNQNELDKFRDKLQFVNSTKSFFI